MPASAARDDSPGEPPGSIVELAVRSPAPASSLGRSTLPDAQQPDADHQAVVGDNLEVRLGQRLALLCRTSLRAAFRAQEALATAGEADREAVREEHAACRRLLAAASARLRSAGRRGVDGRLAVPAAAVRDGHGGNPHCCGLRRTMRRTSSGRQVLLGRGVGARPKGGAGPSRYTPSDPAKDSPIDPPTPETAPR